MALEQYTTHGQEAARTLIKLGQGKCRVTDLAIDFSTHGSKRDWNIAVLADAFFQGLSDRIKDHLVASDLPADLDSLIALTIKINKLLLEQSQC